MSEWDLFVGYEFDEYLDIIRSDIQLLLTWDLEVWSWSPIYLEHANIIDIYD